MSDAVTIRRLTDYSAADAASIGSLLTELSNEADGRPVPEARLRAIIEAPDRDQFVAELNGQLVGVATLNLIVSSFGEMAWLSDFVTSAKADIRGKGIGYQLWRQICAWCLERDVELAFTSNPERQAAHRFYERQGAIKRETNVYYVPISAMTK